jgi:hypothetical protein
VRAEFESVSRSLTSARSSIDARDKEIARLGRMLADAGGRSIAAMADDGGEGPALVEAKNIIVDVCVNAGLWWEPMLVMWHSPICDFLIFCGQKKKKKKKNMYIGATIPLPPHNPNPCSSRPGLRLSRPRLSRPTLPLNRAPSSTRTLRHCRSAPVTPRHATGGSLRSSAKCASAPPTMAVCVIRGEGVLF